MSIFTNELKSIKKTSVVDNNQEICDLQSKYEPLTYAIRNPETLLALRTAVCWLRINSSGTMKQAEEKFNLVELFNIKH